MDDKQSLFQEFMNNPLDMDKRKQAAFSDELVVRKAKIYKVLGPNDDRLQVQVLPELQSIPDNEMDDLPKYPPFIKGHVVTGKSHVKYGKEAEFVWVFCTADLQVGYILGKANRFEKSTQRFNDSYSYRDIKSFISARRALPSDFDYEHLDVVHWVSTDKGGMIQCYNYLTGDWVLLNTSGAILTVQQKMIYLRVGTPPFPPKLGPVAFSAITLTPDKIHFKAPNIEFDAIDLILAHNGFSATGILGQVPSADNGVPVIPVRNVHI